MPSPLSLGPVGTAAAWVLVIVTSLLPRVVLQEVFRVEVSAGRSTLVSGAFLVAALAGSSLWRQLRGLRPLVVLLLVLVVAEWLVLTVVGRLPVYRAWLGDPAFAVWMPAQQSLRLMVTLMVVAALLALHRRPSSFFLTPGHLSAPMQRVRWLGVEEGTRWSRFGPIAAVAISGGTLAFLVLSSAPPPDLVARAVPLLPVVLVAAALNAVNEEVTYKASFLSVLEGPVGRRQSLLMVAAYFGIGHYYGVPYGVLGVAMAFVLGWLLGRSMLETRGLFWAWVIHFVQDVLVFSFLAVGSVSPGG